MNRDVMTRLVRAGRKANRIDEMLLGLGYGSTPYASIYGDITDAIYEMLGENTETFHESLTFQVMMDDSLTDEQCADKLLAARQSAKAIPARTKELLEQAAASRGIATESMISVILSEWVLRNELLSTLLTK